MRALCIIIAIVLSFTNPDKLSAQNKPDSIVVLPLRIAVPQNAVKKGNIKAGNNATETHCDYEAVIADAKEQARALGGNIVKITALIPPAFISKCYSIKADVFYLSELPDSLLPKTQITGSNTTGGYAVLYIYRLSDSIMLAPSYSLHLNNDSVISFIKNKSRNSVKIYKDGPLTLWAKTQHRAELKLDVKYGQSYYIRCGVSGGEFNRAPVIEKIDEKTGAREFGNTEKMHKDQSVKYLQEIH